MRNVHNDIYPVCPICKTPWHDYHGFLGYETLKCDNGHDINDIIDAAANEKGA